MMRKLILVLGVLLISTINYHFSSYATEISYSKTFVDGEVLTAGDLETMKADITTVVNAGGGPVGLTNNQTISGNKTLSGTTTMSGVLTATGVVSGSTAFIFEGTTVDEFETNLLIEDPTTDADVTVPNATGSLVVFENPNTQDVNLIFEGATSDDFENTLTIVDPTADRTVTFPDETIDFTGYSTEGVLKGWAKWPQNTTPDDSFNVSSIDDNAAGNWDINWDTDFAAATYVVLCGCLITGNNIFTCSADNSEYAVGSVNLRFIDGGGTRADCETGHMVIAIGDQ